MVPPPAAAATATATRAHRHVGSSQPRRWTPLRLVPGRSRRSGRGTRLFGNSRLLSVLSASIVVVSLLAVVVAQAMLANGQVRLSTLQHQLSLEQSTHRQAELAVSELETPSRIVGAATSQLGMTHPNVVELPYASLSVPVATPHVTPAPAAPPVTTTAGSSSSSAGGAGTTSTSGTTSSGSAASSGGGSTAGTGTSSSTTTATSTP